MAVTFNGPLKISRPGFTADGVTPNSSAVPNRQAWVAPVVSVLAIDLASGAPAANFPADVVPAGSLIVGIQAIVTTAPTAAETITVSLGGTAPANAIATIAIPSTLTVNPIPGVASTAQAAVWLNTGTSDLALSSSGNASGGAGVILVTLVLRNADGSLSDEGYRPFVQ